MAWPVFIGCGPGPDGPSRNDEKGLELWHLLVGEGSQVLGLASLKVGRDLPQDAAQPGDGAVLPMVAMPQCHDVKGR
jgi:hypothetical protein